MAKYTTNELNKQAADIIEKPIRDEIIAMAKGKKGKSLEGGFSQEFVDGLVETYHKKSDLKDFGLSKELQEELKADHKLKIAPLLNGA